MLKENKEIDNSSKFIFHVKNSLLSSKYMKQTST